MNEPQRKPWLRPGVKALIVHEGKVLLIRERLKDGYIITDFPGGGVEYGEELIAALQREVSEEVGIQVIPDRVVGAWSFLIEQHQVQIVCIGYRCHLAEPVTGEPVLDLTKNPMEENIFEAVWLTPAEIIADPDLLRSDDMLDAVRQLQIS